MPGPEQQHPHIEHFPSAADRKWQKPPTGPTTTYPEPGGAERSPAPDFRPTTLAGLYAEIDRLDALAAEAEAEFLASGGTMEQLQALWPRELRHVEAVPTRVRVALDPVSWSNRGPTRAAVLEAVDHGIARPRDIAHHIGRHESQVSAILGRLSRAGLVRKTATGWERA